MIRLPKFSRDTWIAIGLMIAGAAARLLLARYARPEVTPFDDLDYLGRSLYFSRGGSPDVWRAPGQIWLIGWTLRLTMYQFLAARMAQAVVACAVLPLVWWVARRYLPPRWALGALALAAFWPEFLMSVTVILSEALSMTLLAGAAGLTLWTMDKAADDSKSARWRALLAGAAWGATALTRDEFFFIALALFIPILIAAKRNWRIALPMYALLIAGMLAVVLPYTARNIIRRDTVTLITNHGAYNLWEHWNHRISKPRLVEEFFSWPEGERQSRAFARALDELRDSPGFAIRQGARSFVRMFAPDTMMTAPLAWGLLGNAGPPLITPFFFLTLLGTLLVIFGYGAAAMAHWRRPEFWLLHVIILVSLLGHALAYGQGRYRVPWMPLMMVGALAGWREIMIHRGKMKIQMIAAGAATFLILLAGTALIGRETKDIIAYQRETGRAQWQERRAAKTLESHYNTLQFIIDQKKKAAAQAEQSPWPPPR